MSNSSNKVALVTGGAIRVGRAIALELARNGYTIALHYNSSAEKALETMGEIRRMGGQVEGFQQDLSQTEELSTFFDRVLEKMGRLDVLVNSASVYDPGVIRDTNLDLYRKQFLVNLDAPFFLTRSFANRCEGGHIINIIDNKIATRQFQYSAYLLSKKALAELTTLSAVELAPGFRVNGVAPGVTLPPPDRSPEYLEWRRRGIPLQELGDPDYIAKAVTFFLSSDFITGQILHVDGGESISNTGLNTGNFGGNH